MFNLSGSEIVVILLLALVVLGPEKLPDAMRRAGKAFAEIKKLSSGFQDEVRKGFDEPAREVRKTAAAVKSAARMTTDTVTGKDAGKDKLRYNPATDPAPEPPEGSSVAEPLVEPSPDVVDTTAEEVTTEPAAAVDAIEPVGVSDAVTAMEEPELVEPAEVIERAAAEAEPADSAEADRTA